MKNKEQGYGEKMSILRDFCCLLFAVDRKEFGKVLAFCLSYFMDDVRDDFTTVHHEINQEQRSIFISESDILYFHFALGGSYLMMKRAISALKRIFEKNKFDVALKFASESQLVLFRHQLDLPKIRVLGNNRGGTVGRICDALEMHNFVFSNKKLVSYMNFFPVNNTTPCIITENHTDGSSQSASVSLTDSCQKIHNLEFCGHPAALQILTLEQEKESLSLIAKICENVTNLVDSIEKQGGTSVVCIKEDCEFSGCQLCEHEWPREKITDRRGNQEMYHLKVPTVNLYGWDVKAAMKKVACAEGYCFKCDCNLKTHSYRNILKDHHSFKMTSLEDYVQASNICKNHLEAYAASLPMHKRPEQITDVDWNDFESSTFFKEYRKELRTEFGCDKFKGFQLDEKTPLMHHITDTLHLSIKCADFALELMKLCGEQAEIIHPAHGIHSVGFSLRCCGLGDLAVPLLEEGRRECKISNAYTVTNSLVETVTQEKAFAEKFKEKIAKGKIVRTRLEELIKFIGGTRGLGCKKSAGSTKPSAQGLAQTVLELLKTKTHLQIEELMTDEEHKSIQRELATRRVEAHFIQEDSRSKKPIEVIRGTNLKANGGHAKVIYYDGGGETFFHCINTFLVTLKLKNRNALDDVLQKLGVIELRTQAAEASMKKLMLNVALVQEVVGGNMNINTENKESIISEISSNFDEFLQVSEEAEQYRSQTVKLGQDALALVSPHFQCEMNPICGKAFEVFKSFKAVVCPFLYPHTDDVNELLEVLDEHPLRVQQFLEALDNADLNIRVFDHSFYFHNLLAPGHMDEEYRYFLTNFNIHPSKLNTQTSEGVHKFLQGTLKNLQAFTHRSVGTGKLVVNDCGAIFNKLSFVMHERMARLFFYPETIARKRPVYKCGICDSTLHTQKNCKERCSICGSYYYKHHSKKTCKLSVSPLQPHDLFEEDVFLI